MFFLIKILTKIIDNIKHLYNFVRGNRNLNAAVSC